MQADIQGVMKHMCHIYIYVYVRVYICMHILVCVCMIASGSVCTKPQWF